MRRVKKRLLVLITSLAMVLGFLWIPAVSLAEDEPASASAFTFTIDNFSSIMAVASYQIGDDRVDVSILSTAAPQGVVTAASDSPSDVLSALNSAVLGMQNFNADTMEPVFVADDGFTVALQWSDNTFEYTQDFNGFPRDHALYFRILQKNTNGGQGGQGGQNNRRNVQISMSSSDTNWRGVPCVYENDFPYEEDNETVNWNYNTMRSYKYCTLFVNNLDPDSRADFDDASTKSVSFEPKQDHPGVVDLTFNFNWNYRPASNNVTINGHDYAIPINFDDRASWLNAFAFEYRNQWISFTITDVELEVTDSGDYTLDITDFNLRPITWEECYIGNFLWRSTPEREGSDDCIPHSELTLISATYPDGIENGRSFDEATLDAESRLPKSAKSAKYITYGATDGNGEMVLPVGTKVTMRVAPEFGYQVTAFKINGTPIESSDIGTGSDVAVFTFTIGSANFHLSADVLQVGNEAVTANTKAISEAGVELGGNESAMKIGTAKLEVEDFTPSPDQENRFQTAAGDYEVKDFIDISLFNTVYKGTSAASWDTPVRTLDNKATIYLALEEDVSDKDIMIVHEKAEGDYETIEATYLAEIGTLAFETNSFSNYAIAVKDNDPTIDFDLSWYDNSGKSYWYENGVRQGTATDPKSVIYDGTVRGREIYDPVRSAWFWLDADAEGAMARNKEVFVPYIYQDEKKWTTQTMRDVSYESDKEVYDYIYLCMISGEGKWTRYDSAGKMIKGWFTVDESLADIYPKQVGNTYYYDHMTGAMVKGYVTIDGKRYHFDERTGVLTD